MSKATGIDEVKAAGERLKAARADLVALNKKVGTLEEQLKAQKAKVPAAEAEAREAEKELDGLIKKNIPTILRQSGDAKLNLASLISDALSGAQTDAVA